VRDDRYLELFSASPSPSTPDVNPNANWAREIFEDERDAGLEPCVHRARNDSRWIDVNTLVAKLPPKGTRVRVAGRFIRLGGRPYLASACRPSHDEEAISLRIDDSCFEIDELLVIDAKLDELSMVSRMCQADGIDAELTDAHVVGAPTASQVCNFARAHRADASL
jgi:hypothetical protein